MSHAVKALPALLFSGVTRSRTIKANTRLHAWPLTALYSHYRRPPAMLAAGHSVLPL